MGKYFCKHCLAELPQGTTDYNYDTANLDYECPECGACGTNPFIEGELMTIDYDTFDFTLQEDDAESAFHIGDCEGDVKAVLEKDYVRHQLDGLTDKVIEDHLLQYDLPRKGRGSNEMYLVWMVAGDIADREYERRQECENSLKDLD